MSDEQRPASDNFPSSLQTIKTVPVVAVREVVIFPHTEPVLTFGRTKSMAAIEAAHKLGQMVCLVTQKSASTKDPLMEDLFEYGVLAKIEKLLMIEGVIHALVKAVSRVKILKMVTEDPYFVAEYIDIPETSVQNEDLAALAKHVTIQFKKAVNLGKSVDLSVFMRLMAGVDIGELADQIASTLDIDPEAKQQLLEMSSVNQRLKAVSKYLAHELKVLELEHSISNKTQKRIDKSMREAILRERKKTIDNELRQMGHGEEEDGDPEMAELKKKIKAADMPTDVKRKAEKELSRLAQMSPHNPERSYLQNYLDWLVSMPWNQPSNEEISLEQASKILDNEHYGLKQIKERIVEFLAVMKLKQQQEEGKKKPKNKDTHLRQGYGGQAKKQQESAISNPGGPTILCFVGPPGVGKTSIGKSIANALGRKFVRMSLGGIRDEAEIRGHRRTYIGALPGRIIQGIKNAGTSNPVFMLDEIDKMGVDFRGDPSSALLEALDPEQNREFSDHYLEVPYDLSQVMFITTANLLDPIPPALKDRLEVIQFSGYTEDEKFHIAQKYLWPKQMRFNGLGDSKHQLSEKALREIIHHYTREAGVRSLERNLATICRKIAKQMAEKKLNKGLTINPKDVIEYLGPIKFTSPLADKHDEAGVATGLFYTPVGGGIMFIEVAIMPGTGKLTLTGQLGQVMKESCKAAFSYIRTRWETLGLEPNFAKQIDVHIHVPEGAVPKDGPSAGAAIATAITSALTKIPSHRDVAMTGEITLRGRVTEIGGLKEKVIAAHRAGIKTVILPITNKKDLKDIPEKVQKDIKFVYVSHLDEVLPVALHSYDKRKMSTKPEEVYVAPMSTTG